MFSDLNYCIEFFLFYCHTIIADLSDVLLPSRLVKPSSVSGVLMTERLKLP